MTRPCSPLVQEEWSRDPACDMFLHFFHAIEVVSPQPFRSNGPIVPLEIGVLLRLARLYVDQANPVRDVSERLTATSAAADGHVEAVEEMLLAEQYVSARLATFEKSLPAAASQLGLEFQGYFWCRRDFGAEEVLAIIDQAQPDMLFQSRHRQTFKDILQVAHDNAGQVKPSCDGDFIDPTPDEMLEKLHPSMVIAFRDLFQAHLWLSTTSEAASEVVVQNNAN